ncbi:MAG: HDOD domain-containing protein [Anaeromyxobacter sp.]
MGLFDIFRGRGKLAKELRELEAEAPAGEAVDAAGDAPAGAAKADAADAPDARYAEAMGIDPAIVGASAPSLDAAEREIAGALLEHFEANRPGPASFPAIATKVLELVRDPEVQVPALARLIEDDPALSAAVLVLGNSALYRGVQELRTVKEAIARLGLTEVARIAAALSTRSLYQAGVRAEFAAFAPQWNRLFFHAATTARAGADLAKARRLAEPEAVYLAGMLHDVGKSLALRSLAALTIAGQAEVKDDDALERILHRVHVEVGGAAHQEWGLPRHVAEVAVLHHDAAVPAGPEHAGLHVVRLVSALHLLHERAALHPDAAAEAIQSARALGVGPERVAALVNAIAETEDWVSMMFGDGGGPASAPKQAPKPAR